MYGHKLEVEQIQVLVQARPMPGAVHRPCIQRCEEQDACVTSWTRVQNNARDFPILGLRINFPCLKLCLSFHMYLGPDT